MSKNSTIDDLFKTRLLPQESDRADAAWEKMEARLLQQQKKRQSWKRYLLFLLLVAGSAGLLVPMLYKPTAGSLQGNKIAQQKSTSAGAPVSTSSSQPATNLQQAPTAATHTFYNSKTFQLFARSSQHNLITPPGKAGIQISTAQPLVIPNAAAPETPVTMEPSGPSAVQETTAKHITPARQQNDTEENSITGHSSNTANPSKRKPLLELAAGLSLPLKHQGSGKYAQVLLNIPLSKKTDLVTGLGISGHSLSESYRVSEKQNTTNRETDAKLQSLTMIQLPILYQQSIPRTKLTGRAGITPVYIIDASIVNVPGTFVGTVIPYRRFTLKDLNRVNVLFTAGIQYQLTKKLGLELRGNYGLTELVKNSYINQSNVNNNFKSLQAGLTFRF